MGESGDVNGGDSPSSENDANSADSIGLNPASMSSLMAKSQWRETKSELIESLLECSSSMASTAKDGDEDEEDRENIVGLTPGDGTRIIQGEDDDDNDVNLVLDLLMQNYVWTHDSTSTSSSCLVSLVDYLDSS